MIFWFLGCGGAGVNSVRDVVSELAAQWQRAAWLMM